MNELEAVEVYEILVEEAGASSSEDTQLDFVHHMVRGTNEYRFQGKLGFGGKFWQNDMRVSCYREDETPERREIIRRTNERLKEL